MLADTLLKTLKLDRLYESVVGLIEARVELIKYDVKSEVSKSLAAFLFSVILLFLVYLIVLFASLATAIWLGNELGWIVGFSVIGLFYLFVTLLLLLYRKPIMDRLGVYFMRIINRN